MAELEHVRWEYTTISVGRNTPTGAIQVLVRDGAWVTGSDLDNTLSVYLNKLGGEGWELASTLQTIGDSRTTIIFKRHQHI